MTLKELMTLINSKDLTDTYMACNILQNMDQETRKRWFPHGGIYKIIYEELLLRLARERYTGFNGPSIDTVEKRKLAVHKIEEANVFLPRIAPYKDRLEVLLTELQKHELI